MEYETIQRNNDFLYKTLEFDQAERVEMERMAREAEAEEERKKDRRKSKLAKGRNWSKSKSPSRKKSSIKPVPEEIAQISSIVEDQTPQAIESKFDKKTPKKPVKKGVTGSKRGKKLVSKRK